MPLSAKYGIIADIDGNYAALKVALDYLKMAGVEKILCLGDIVGIGGTQPGNCIDALKHAANIFAIAGTEDRKIVQDKDFAKIAADLAKKDPGSAIKWGKWDISQANLCFLKQLPDGMTIDDTFIMAHSSLVQLDASILNAQEIAKNLNCMITDFPTKKVCFFGHTHIPMLINTKQVITDLRETKTFQLDPKDTYLINPGSVGEPRDKCPLAAFGIFNAENWQMQFIRKPYDVPAAQKRAEGGPPGPSIYPINRLGDWTPNPKPPSDE